MGCDFGRFQGARRYQRPGRLGRGRVRIAPATAAPGRLGHVVDPEHVGTRPEREDVAGDRAAETIVHLAPRELADEALSRRSHDDRPPQLPQLAEPAEQLEVVVDVLPNPIPGSTQMRSSAIPSPTANSIRSARNAFTSSTTSS